MTPVLALALVAGQPAPRPPGLAADLAAPVKLTAGGKPIDVERRGHAAPFVADFDGDGRPDLLVGQFSGGKLRVYRNTAKSGPPRLDGFDWFTASGAPGTIPNGCRTGFAPTLADLDGDGKADVASGSRPGHVYLFRRTADGFAGGERAVHPDRTEVNVGVETVVTAADWDGDGKADLIVGELQGQVFVLRNVGAPGRPAFAPPQRITAGGLPVEAATGMRSAVARLRDEIVRLEAVRDRNRVQSMTHGHVWLFRRQSAEGDAR